MLVVDDVCLSFSSFSSRKTEGTIINLSLEKKSGNIFTKKQQIRNASLAFSCFRKFYGEN